MKKQTSRKEPNSPVVEILPDNNDFDIYEDIYITDMTDEAGDYLITENDLVKNQIYEVFKMLSMKRRDSLIITGIGSCGKTTLLKYMAKQIAFSYGMCPELFKDAKVLLVPQDSFDEDFDSMFEYFSKVLELCDWFEYEKVIFALNDVQKYPIIFAQRFEELLSGIKKVFNLKLVKFVCTADINFSTDSLSLNRVSNSIEISVDTRFENIVDTLWPEVKAFQRKHDVSISKTMATKAVILADYVVTTSNGLLDYDICLDYIEMIICAAEMAGDSVVQSKHLKHLCFSDYSLFKITDKNDIYITSKHEAGHALIALCNPDHYEIQGVKCVCNPNDIGGLCISHAIKVFPTNEDLIVELAYNIAGRIFSGKADLGDSIDLEDASKPLRTWLMQVGLSKKIGENVFIDGEENAFLISDRTKRILEDEVKTFLKKAKKYCKKIQKKYKKFHKLLSKKLVKEMVLTRSEILALWNEYLNQEKKKKK